MASIAIVSGLLGLAGLAWGAWQLSKNTRLSGLDGIPASQSELDTIYKPTTNETNSRNNGEGFATTAEQAQPKEQPTENNDGTINNTGLDILASNGNMGGLSYWDELYKKLFGHSMASEWLGLNKYGTGSQSSEQQPEQEQEQKNPEKKNKGDGLLSGIALKVLNTLLNILGTVLKYSLKFIWLIFAFIVYKIIIKDKK